MRQYLYELFLRVLEDIDYTSDNEKVAMYNIVANWTGVDRLKNTRVYGNPIKPDEDEDMDESILCVCKGFALITSIASISLFLLFFFLQLFHMIFRIFTFYFLFLWILVWCTRLARRGWFVGNWCTRVTWTIGTTWMINLRHEFTRYWFRFIFGTRVTIRYGCATKR